MDVIDEVVKELGGEVFVKNKNGKYGNYVPTDRENYIERIRQLVEKEERERFNSMVRDPNFN